VPAASACEEGTEFAPALRLLTNNSSDPNQQQQQQQTLDLPCLLMCVLSRRYFDFVKMIISC
jgi:hypothetical protein